MKILQGLAILLLMLGVLIGCRSQGRATPDYRTGPFRAEVRWERGGVTVYAEVESAMENGAPTLASVRLLAPPALEGITLFWEDGAPMMARDGVRMSAAGGEDWWEIASLLVAEGEMRYVCLTDWEGLSLEYAEIRNGTRTIEVLREPKTGTLRRLADGEVVLTVIRFESIEARGS